MSTKRSLNEEVERGLDRLGLKGREKTRSIPETFEQALARAKSAEPSPWTAFSDGPRETPSRSLRYIRDAANGNAVGAGSLVRAMLVLGVEPSPNNWKAFTAESQEPQAPNGTARVPAVPPEDDGRKVEDCCTEEVASFGPVSRRMGRRFAGAFLMTAFVACLAFMLAPLFTANGAIAQDIDSAAFRSARRNLAVAGLFQNFLGRAPSESERSEYAGLILQHGLARVVTRIATSPEAKNHLSGGTLTPEQARERSVRAVPFGDSHRAAMALLTIFAIMPEGSANRGAGGAPDTGNQHPPHGYPGFARLQGSPEDVQHHADLLEQGWPQGVNAMYAHFRVRYGDNVVPGDPPLHYYPAFPIVQRVTHELAGHAHVHTQMTLSRNGRITGECDFECDGAGFGALVGVRGYDINGNILFGSTLVERHVNGKGFGKPKHTYVPFRDVRVPHELMMQVFRLELFVFDADKQKDVIARFKSALTRVSK